MVAKPTPPNPWGNLLRAARRAKRWSQNDLATRAGVHRITIIRQERGEVSPDWDTLRRIAHTLGIPLADAASAVHQADYQSDDTPIVPLPYELARAAELYQRLHGDDLEDYDRQIKYANEWAEARLSSTDAIADKGLRRVG